MNVQPIGPELAGNAPPRLHHYTRADLEALLAELQQDPFADEKQPRAVGTLIERFDELTQYQIYATLADKGIEIRLGSERLPDPRAARFPVQVFPEWIRNYAAEVAASCEVPVSVVAFGIMGMLSACYGMHLQVVVKNRYVTYCHDWFVLVAKVSLGKSPVFSHLQEPLRQVQKVLREVDEAEALEEEASKKRKPGHERPRLQCIVSDATPEALVKVQHENGGAVAMVSPETVILSQMANTTRPIPLQPYLSSHTGEAYEVVRIERGPNDIERARLAMFVATQEVGLREIMGRPEIVTKGIVPRSTFYVAPPITEEDLRDDDPEVTEELAVRYERTLRELGIRYRSNELSPLRFSNDAKKARRRWRNDFKRTHKLEGGALHGLTEHASKLEDKVIRWAGLLHVLWCAEENRDPGEITLEDWTRALQLVPFDLHHFRAAMEKIEQGPSELLADKLRSWFRSRTGETIRYRDLRRQVRAFKGADERTQEAALRALEDDAVIRCVENMNPGGTPSPAVVVL